MQGINCQVLAGFMIMWVWLVFIYPTSTSVLHKPQGGAGSMAPEGFLSIHIDKVYDYATTTMIAHILTLQFIN